MKILFLYIFTFFTLSQVTGQSLQDILKAFRTNNTSGVVAHLDDKLEVTVDGKNATYNKEQASAFVADFFKNNRVSNFKILHQSEKAGTAYCIGNLSTSGGNYRITLFIKDKSGKSMLQEIRLEK